jgi:hypothetical protein
MRFDLSFDVAAFGHDAIPIDNKFKIGLGMA